MPARMMNYRSTRRWITVAIVTEKIKGAIRCPICHKGKIIAYEGSSGKASVGCPKCPGLLLVDYDAMTAVPNTQCKDAYKYAVNN